MRLLIDIGANLLDPMFQVRCMCCHIDSTSCSSQRVSRTSRPTRPQPDVNRSLLVSEQAVSWLQGEYNRRSYHSPDIGAVLQRSWDAGAACLSTCICAPLMQAQSLSHLLQLAAAATGKCIGSKHHHHPAALLKAC